MFVKPYPEPKHKQTPSLVLSQSQFQTFRNTQVPNQLQGQHEEVLLMKLRIEELQREIAGVHQRSSNLQKENQRLNLMILRNNTREAKRTEHFIEKLTYMCGNKSEKNENGRDEGGFWEGKRKQCQINSRKSSSKRNGNLEMNSFGKGKANYSSTINDQNNSFIGNNIKFKGKKDFKKLINQKLSSTHLK